MAVENTARVVEAIGNKIGWQNLGYGVGTAIALPLVPFAGIGLGTAAAIGGGIALGRSAWDAVSAKWNETNQKIPQDLQEAANYKPYDYEGTGGGQYTSESIPASQLPTYTSPPSSTYTSLPFRYETQTSSPPTSFPSSYSSDYYSTLQSNPQSLSASTPSYYGAALPTATPPTFGSLYGVAGGGGMMVNTAESVGTAAQRIARARALQQQLRKKSSSDEAQKKKIKTIAGASASGLFVLTVVVAAITCIVGGNTSSDNEKNKNENSSYKTFMTAVGTATLGLGILVAVHDVVLPIVNIAD